MTEKTVMELEKELEELRKQYQSIYEKRMALYALRSHLEKQKYALAGLSPTRVEAVEEIVELVDKRLFELDGVVAKYWNQISMLESELRAAKVREKIAELRGDTK